MPQLPIHMITPSLLPHSWTWLFFWSIFIKSPLAARQRNHLLVLVKMMLLITYECFLNLKFQGTCGGVQTERGGPPGCKAQCLAFAGCLPLLPGLVSLGWSLISLLFNLISGTGSLPPCTKLALFKMHYDSLGRSIFAIVQLFIGLAALLFIGLPFVFKYSPYIQVKI